MNTFLSAAQKSLQEQYLKFVNEVVAPHAADLDAGKACSKDMLTKLSQAGYLGITVPKELGGQGGDLLDAVLFVEALAGHSAGLAMALASHFSVIEVISRYGAELKTRYLPLLARGEMIGAQAFSEDKAGSDLSGCQTSFSSSSSSAADAKLTGTKTWVVNADMPALFAVLAKDENGFKVFLVDSQNNALALSERKSTMGFRSARFFDVEFKGAKASAEALSGDGLVIAAAALDLSKVLIAGAALGLMNVGIKLAAERANSREQFGAPIAKYQGVQWKLADFSTESAASQMLTYRAAWSHAAEPEEFRKYAAMAKSYASRSARLHSAEAVQIFGVMGISCDEPLERIYRDAKLTEVLEGTSEVQKVILKEQLGV